MTLTSRVMRLEMGVAGTLVKERGRITVEMGMVGTLVKERGRMTVEMGVAGASVKMKWIMKWIWGRRRLWW